jgi:ParB family chromosome partitioning protein
MSKTTIENKSDTSIPQSDVEIKETDKKSEIVYIDIAKLHPHDKNPRKNVGDISELAESIKKNGVLQNLTVVPATGYWYGDYTVIIGHRRLAAAKKAGITEVPCVISEMTPQEQFHTMLTENMQRIDLTPMEQAQGFQIMFDEWGYDEKKISETTGFSETTVRHRLNMAKLSSKAVETYENDNGFQLSLSDFYALEKVPTVKERNEILKKASSSRDIQIKAAQAETNARRDKAETKIVKLLKKAVSDIEEFPKGASIWDGTWETLKSISLDKSIPDKITISRAKKDDKLYYYRYFNEITVYRKKPKRKKVESDFDRERKECNKRHKQLSAELKKMTARRRDFVLDIIDGRIDALPAKETESVKDEIWNVMLSKSNWFAKNEIVNFIVGKNYYDVPQDEQDAAKEKAESFSVLHQMLAVMCMSLTDINTHEYNCNYNKANADILKTAYAVLERYGWTFEDEEQSILDGTHELYTTPETEKK